jgi:hypothetical protein
MSSEISTEVDGEVGIDASAAEAAPGLDPAVAAAPIAVVVPRRKRAFPWRWVGAVVTMLAVGAGCAFAVMAPQRTQLPGLKTASNGRYDFAPLVLPTLAPGQSDPSSSANPGEQHISDIRKLLLSPPKGATADRSLPGASGWVSKSATAALLNAPTAGGPTVEEQLGIDGWRHTAGIAWKTPDAAETKIWLLQFIDADAAGDANTLFANSDDGAQTTTAESLTGPGSTTVEYTRQVNGSTATWYGQADIYDTEILIKVTAPASIGITPFEQELDLQIELLL